MSNSTNQNGWDLGRNLIEKIVTVWAETKKIPVDYENVPESFQLKKAREKNKEVYLRTTIIDTGTNQAELGECGLAKHTCVGQVDLFVPKNSGTKRARDLLNDLMRVFRIANTLDSVKKRSVQIRQPAMTQGSLQDEVYMMSMQIPIEFVIFMNLESAILDDTDFAANIGDELRSFIWDEDGYNEDA